MTCKFSERLDVSAFLQFQVDPFCSCIYHIWVNVPIFDSFLSEIQGLIS
jgi:hypothetical protein